MKKVIFIMALLAIAVPAMAGVTVTVTDNADGTATIGYTSDANVAAFGIDVTVDAGTITAVDAAKVGISESGDLGYGIFPGSFRDYIDADDPCWADANYVPLGAAGDPGVLGGLGTAGVTLEFAAVYADGNAPDRTGTLCTVTVSQTCKMTVTANNSSAGIVLEGGALATIDALATNVDVTLPASVCVGDVDKNGYRNKLDIQALVNLLVDNASAPAWKIEGTHAAFIPEADVDGNGYINKLDIQALVNLLVDNASAPAWKFDCPQFGLTVKNVINFDDSN